MDSITSDKKELIDQITEGLMWIDAIPADQQFPAMPGFDRDWVEGLVDDSESAAKDELELAAYAIDEWINAARPHLV